MLLNIIELLYKHIFKFSFKCILLQKKSGIETSMVSSWKDIKQNLSEPWVSVSLFSILKNLHKIALSSVASINCLLASNQI